MDWWMFWWSYLETSVVFFSQMMKESVLWRTFSTAKICNSPLQICAFVQFCNSGLRKKIFLTSWLYTLGLISLRKHTHTRTHTYVLYLFIFKLTDFTFVFWNHSSHLAQGRNSRRAWRKVALLWVGKNFSSVVLQGQVCPSGRLYALAERNSSCYRPRFHLEPSGLPSPRTLRPNVLKELNG